MMVLRNKEDTVNKHITLHMVEIQYLMDTPVFDEYIAQIDTEVQDQIVEFPCGKNQVEFRTSLWVLTMVQKKPLSRFQTIIGNQLGRMIHYIGVTQVW